MDKKKILIIVAGVIAVAALAGCIILPLYFNNKMGKMEEAYLEEIVTLEGTIAEYGERDFIYVLNREVAAGQEVSMDHFVTIEQPTSVITEEYIKDEADLKSTYYKLDMKPGTPLTFSVIGSDIITHQDRYLDITAHIFPVYLKAGDFVDLRLVTDYGQNYIVLSKKRVIKWSDNTIRIIMNEEEIHLYESATVDTFLNPGTVLYCTTYVEPAFQNEAQRYYPVSQDVLNAMLIDPNIQQVAELEIIEKRRERFETDMESHTDSSQNAAVASGRQEAVSKFNEDLQAYRDKINEGLIDPETGKDIKVVPEGEEAEAPPETTTAQGTDPFVEATPPGEVLPVEGE